MKYFFLTFLSAIFLNFISADNLIDSAPKILGLTFGSSQAACKAVLAKRSDFKMLKYDSDNNILDFGGGVVSGRKAVLLILAFTSDRLYGIDFKLPPSSEPRLLDNFKSIEAEISQKYGQPVDITRDYKSPYRENDGYELSAIKNGYVTINNTWLIGKDDTAFLISLRLDEDTSSSLNYVYVPLLKTIPKKETEL